MPRPPRRRRIEGYPDHWSFAPDDTEEKTAETVILSLDEYETIRLMDREGMTQEQCAERMGVARTTVTAIYDSARKKLARVLVDGVRLRISGGSYQLPPNNTTNIITEKGIETMRIAVTYENGEIFQHFGRTSQFKIYDVEDGKIVKEEIVDTFGTGHGALAGFLRGAQADALICGGIGMGAQMALAEAGVKLYAGVSGSADEAAAALAAGTLQYDPDAHCDHHDHEEGHGCGCHGEGHGPHGEGHGRHGEGEGHGCGCHGEGHGPHGEGHGRHGEGEGHDRHGEGHGPHGEGHGPHGEGHGRHGEGRGPRGEAPEAKTEE